jgi:hypothetical protein
MYNRSYYWLKDLMCPASRVEPDPKTDVLGVIDVDYYMDMPDLLTKTFATYLLYTFVPSRASKDSGEYKYCFLPDGGVEYRVSGGGRYSHRLWSWDGDSLRVVRKFCGIPWSMVGYAVERRQMDEDHQLILLVPLVKTANPLTTWIAARLLQAQSLRRLNPVVGAFVRLETNEPDQLYMCTGKVGEYASAKVPASVDYAIQSATRTLSSKLTLATVKSKMDNGRTAAQSNHVGSEVLLEFHQQYSAQKDFVSIVSAVRRFQWVRPGLVPDVVAKPGMVAFMQPLLDGGFVPDVCEGNEQRFVQERVEKIKCSDAVMDKFTSDCMTEFVELLVPSAHALHPVSTEEVFERQPRPSQRAILREAQHGQPTDVTKQFMKKEAYGSVTDPRGISQINGVDKMYYSAYLYAFTDGVMKKQVWYAFGKSPSEIARRVCDICADSDYVDMTDFSRMDGRVSNIARELERRAMFRAFGRDYTMVLYELMRKQTFLTAITTTGIKYKTEFQRLSGSPETSAFNTMLTAFIAYLTYRRQKNMYGAFNQAPEAWAMLGIYGGDDGLSACFDQATAKATAGRVGQKLELVRVWRGDMGVSFLARTYGPDVWNGDDNSCCSLKRQLAKLHLTVHLPGNIPPWKKLQEKSFSFYLTDRFTPVIGEFVTRVLTLFPLGKEEFRNVLNIYGVELDESRQYPNRQADWMECYALAELPDFDFDRFRNWLDSSNRDTIFCAPRFAESLPPDPKFGVCTVDDDLVVNMPPDRSGEPASRTETPTDGKPTFRPRKPKDRKQSRVLKQGRKYTNNKTPETRNKETRNKASPA